jgi:hypothetical protein
MVSRYRQYGDAHVALAVHTHRAPSDPEWQEYLDCVQEMLRHTGSRFKQCAGLAITDGGAPSAAQRHRFVTTLGEQRPVAAVVTDSALVRGVVTALAWFSVGIRSYSPAAFAAGLRHVGIAQAYHATVMQDILDASRELSSSVATVESLGRELSSLRDSMADDASDGSGRCEPP